MSLSSSKALEAKLSVLFLTHYHHTRTHSKNGRWLIKMANGSRTMRFRFRFYCSLVRPLARSFARTRRSLAFLFEMYSYLGTATATAFEYEYEFDLRLNLSYLCCYLDGIPVATNIYNYNFLKWLCLSFVFISVSD